MNLVTSELWYSGSGGTSRLGISRLRGMNLSLLGALRAVLGTTLHSTLHADRVERPADHVVAHARQILDAAAANEHQRVLLQVVADARNVGGHFDAVGEPDARDLAERGVGLLRGLGEHADAHAALLRAVLQCRTLGLADDLLAPGADELTDSRHSQSQKCGTRNANTDSDLNPIPHSAVRIQFVASGLEAPFMKRGLGA